jgi:hypothetical protein
LVTREIRSNYTCLTQGKGERERKGNGGAIISLITCLHASLESLFTNSLIAIVMAFLRLRAYEQSRIIEENRDAMELI